MVVAGTKDAVLMVESEANELSEDLMLGSVLYGHQEMQKVIKACKELRAKVNPTPWDFSEDERTAEFKNKIADSFTDEIASAFKIADKASRGEAIKYYSSDRITQIVGNGLVCLIDEKTKYRNFFDENEMVFYRNTNDLSEKILKISSDDKLRKKIAKRGKFKYMKYFNSDLVSEYIIDKILNIRSNKKYLWEK